MSCPKARELLGAYFDGELDTVESLACENHLQTCGSCRAIEQQYQSLRECLRTSKLYYEASESLKERVRRGTGAPVARRANWPFRAIAAGVAVVLSGVTLVSLHERTYGEDLLARDVLSSHIRSLMANHLADVSSSNRHTVKPWFDGKLDFAPAVKDLSSKGFLLIGGRLDYLDGRPVAALVYKRGQHVINLFVWPSADRASGPEYITSKGYNVVHGTHAHMAYWAVSDLNADELAEFARETEE